MEDDLQRRRPQQKMTLNNCNPAKLAKKCLYDKSCKSQQNFELNFQILEQLEDDFQGRRPQQKMTFDNWKSAELAL